jgi:hypothetical protein
VSGKPMPLMNDWSDHLVRKLAQRNDYLEATGLRHGHEPVPGVGGWPS